MKFLLLATLALSAVSAVTMTQKAAIKLSHHDDHHGPPHGDHHGDHHGHHGPNPMDELVGLVEAHIEEHGNMTADAAHDIVQSVADKYGFEMTEEMWEHLGYLFDMIDTNDDMVITAEELEEAMAYMRGEKEVKMPTEEEIEAWVTEEFERDGDITFEEIEAAINHWAEE